MSIYNELKRRNVFRVAVAYVIVGWLILQVGEVLAPALRLPDWVNSTLAFFIILGFPLAVVFAWAFEMTPEGLKREKDVDRSNSITHQTGQKLNHAIIALLALALAFFAYDKFVLDPDRDAAQVQAALESARDAGEDTAAGEPDEKSIAVLPFVNMSNDPDQEYFSDGIAEELLNVLARYPGLRVAARTSSFQFKGQNLDVADIARQLRVNHVLEGSVRKAGNRVRITAQLIEAEAGYHLWSESFDRELDDIFAVQDEISAAIGEALKVTLALDGADAPAVPHVTTASSTAAFDAYLAGRQLINQRGRSNIERAMVILEGAVGQDPDYAPAHAQLAIAYLMLANTGGTYGDWPFPEARARALPHIERALELDEYLPEAHGALALMAVNEPDYVAALEHTEQALRLNPSYVDAINWAHIAAQNLGRHQESMALLEKLLEIDPLSVVGRFNWATNILAYRGELEAAKSLADSIGAQNPGGRYTARGTIAHDIEGDLAAAVDWFLKEYDRSPGDTFANAYLAYIFGQLDLMPEALRMREDQWHWAYTGQLDWTRAAAELRQRLEENPDNPDLLTYLANNLLFSGELAGARDIYDQLLAAAGGRAIIDPAWSSPVPTLRAAYIRQSLGDTAGAQRLMGLALSNLQALDRAGLHGAWYYRCQAIIGAMEGNDAAALHYMEKAFATGHRDLSLFAEPALTRLADEPAFQDLERRMTADLAAQRQAVLQLICFDNPAIAQWRPLPQTCEGLKPGA